jgi:hypothetical protein
MVDLFSPPGQRANSGVMALIGIGLAFWAAIRLWGSTEELFGGMLVVEHLSGGGVCHSVTVDPVCR